MARSNGRLGPLSSIDVAIEGEPLAKDGLRKKREELERIVAPFVTTRKTADEILFKGKRRYLKFSMLNESSLNPQYWAVIALQHLYNIEVAWTAGDIDKVVRATVGFGNADAERRLTEWAGATSVSAAAFQVRTTRRRVETRKGKSKLKDVPDLVLQAAYATHNGKRNWLNCVTEDVVRHRGGAVVSSKTVSEELRKRGIVE